MTDATLRALSQPEPQVADLLHEQLRQGVAHLPVAEEVLDDMKRVLNLGADAGLIE